MNGDGVISSLCSFPQVVNDKCITVIYCKEIKCVSTTQFIAILHFQNALGTGLLPNADNAHDCFPGDCIPQEYFCLCLLL